MPRPNSPPSMATMRPVGRDSFTVAAFFIFATIGSILCFAVPNTLRLIHEAQHEGYPRLAYWFIAESSLELAILICSLLGISLVLSFTQRHKHLFRAAYFLSTPCFPLWPILALLEVIRRTSNRTEIVDMCTQQHVDRIMYFVPKEKTGANFRINITLTADQASEYCWSYPDARSAHGLSGDSVFGLIIMGIVATSVLGFFASVATYQFYLQVRSTQTERARQLEGANPFLSSG